MKDSRQRKFIPIYETAILCRLSICYRKLTNIRVKKTSEINFNQIHPQKKKGVNQPNKRPHPSSTQNLNPSRLSLTINVYFYVNVYFYILSPSKICFLLRVFPIPFMKSLSSGSPPLLVFLLLNFGRPFPRDGEYRTEWWDIRCVIEE